MTDLADILAGVLAEPDDDLPRLAYADRLDELAEAAHRPTPSPRADFIRIQIRLAREPEVCTTPNVCCYSPNPPKYVRGEAVYFCGKAGCIARNDLRRRHAELWDRGVYREIALPWTAAGCEDEGHPYLDDMDRGFLARVTCPGPAWVAHADAILAAHPIREVTLTTVPRLEATRGGLYARIRGRTKELAYGAGRMWWQMAPDLLAAEWPRIDFTIVPGAPVPMTAEEFDAGGFSITYPPHVIPPAPTG